MIIRAEAYRAHAMEKANKKRNGMRTIFLKSWLKPAQATVFNAI
ncbi:hypothetical protein CPter91_0766 [Collimonas pratensis]|uniref:Uncharacterized protein n=1 Tax=Collimonas pratensis TaxID=279113 RepID=A0A127PZD6_9BURK|nr:hypothetical protein CPter91_0766 [Collimonas pratensis]